MGWVGRVMVSVVAICALVACAGADESQDDGGDGEPEGEATADALQSSPLNDADMKKINTPPGMPEPWDQPNSTGTFQERGKCGPTAVANALRLYGIEVSPEKADRDGVNWAIGTRGINIEWYMRTKHRQLGCTLEHPNDGPAFLRAELAAGHPIMVWYNTTGSFLGSHWVTVVGRRGSGASEVAIVMSWGSYYTIPMAKLDAAWRNVYWINHPSIVCDKTTSLLVR